MTSRNDTPEMPSSHWWDCDGTAALVLTVDRTEAGALWYRVQCLRCGRGKHVPKGKLGLDRRSAAVPFDRTIEQRWWEHRREAGQAEVQERDAARAVEDARWWARYDAYLRSAAWRERRRKVLERAGGLCEACRERPAAEVHHLTYRHAGREPLFDLVAVCGGCHEDITEMDRAGRPPL